jgi:hypothetical protein
LSNPIDRVDYCGQGGKGENVGSPTTTTLIVNATELQKLYQRQSKGRVVKQHLGKICSFFDPSVFFLFLLGGGACGVFIFVKI